MGYHIVYYTYHYNLYYTERNYMIDYKPLYFKLMAEVSEAIERLITAIRDAEDEYCKRGASDAMAPSAGREE